MPAPPAVFPDYYLAPADRALAAELQAFHEANPQYWWLTHGHAPAADDAATAFDKGPPAHMSFRAHPWSWARGCRTHAILGQFRYAVDLMAPGVWHLGFFMVDSRLQGTGFARDLYARYEALAVAGGARWLRLGVVEANPRARRFWARCGYADLRHSAGIVLGDMAHVQFIMIKTLGTDTLADYLHAVPHDAANA
jgi:GNAT superfamily N-acetyltransferase